MKILVFNRHEPYIELFARTGHDFFVAPPSDNRHLIWRRSFRPVPSNVTEISFDEAIRARIDFDLAIALAPADVVSMLGAKRILFVELNMISECTGSVGKPRKHPNMVRRFANDLCFKYGVEVAFISEKKKADWLDAYQDAPVIVSGIDVNYWTPPEDTTRSLDRRAVLRVGNMLKQRDAMQGFGVSERILRDLPVQTVGIQNGAIKSFEPPDAYVLREQYRRNRVMLSCLDDEREDGYNLAVIEAMACGIPVVCMPNSTAPAMALTATDERQARLLLEELLSNRDMAVAVGASGRHEVVTKFNLCRCAAEWNEVFTSG